MIDRKFDNVSYTYNGNKYVYLASGTYLLCDVHTWMQINIELVSPTKPLRTLYLLCVTSLMVLFIKGELIKCNEIFHSNLRIFYASLLFILSWSIAYTCVSTTYFISWFRETFCGRYFYCSQNNMNEISVYCRSGNNWKKMKFAEHLSAHITPEWRKQYISYEVK